MLFSTAYLPPIAYVLEMMKSKELPIIELHEHYAKQSFRNRAQLLGANGVFSLSVPVLKKSNSKTLVKDIEIKYDENWQNNHWRSITSAYLSSPFFAYYMSDLEKFYTKKYKFLIDFNEDLLSYLINKMNLDLKWTYSESFFPKSEITSMDLRDVLHPKKNYQELESIKSYRQVFSDKFDFIPNLSALDLLCNEGQNAENYLKQCLSIQQTVSNKFIFPSS